MLAASRVIEEDNLDVIAVCAVDREPVSSIAGCESHRVHINELAVTLVTEHQALLRGSVRAEVRRVIDVALVRLPRVEGQISLSWLNSFVLHEDLTEVLLLHSMGQIDVTTNLGLSLAFLLLLLASDEENGGHATIF